MSYKQSKQEKEFRIISSCHNAGFSKFEIEEKLGKSISNYHLENALNWQQEQTILSDEIGSLKNALIQTRKLKKQANQMLRINYNSIHASLDTCTYLIKQISELIEAELNYKIRIDALSKELDSKNPFADIAALPLGIFTPNLEHNTTEVTSENENNYPDISTGL